MAIEIENELTLKDYISIVRRKWLLVISIFLLSMIVITAVVFNLSPVYKSQGFIAIDSPVISAALIGSNDLAASKYVDERLDKIKQKIFSRESLVKFNQKYKLYPLDKKPSFIASMVKNNITLKPKRKSVNGNDWGGQVTIGLQVAAVSGDAEKTYKMINDIISQLLDQNAKDRTSRAIETTSYLTAELNSLKNELTVTEEKVAAYKQKNSNSLPEHQLMHLSTLNELRDSLKDLDSMYQATLEELRYLDVELTTTNATINNASDSSNGGLVAVSKLDQAREELERSLVLYKETHPTIRALKRKVALLEKSELAHVEKPVRKLNVAGVLAVTKINSQIQAANARLTTIEEEKKTTRKQIEKVRRQIITIPQVESGLAVLLRDYENAKVKYDEVKSKQVNAKIVESLELENKAEHFVLLESPEYPQYKEGMSKSKMVVLGFPISLALGIGLALLLEMLDKKVRRQSTLSLLINAKPIATIPYIQTAAELNKKRKLIHVTHSLIKMLVFFLIVLAIIHFFITPLDELMEMLRGL